MWMHFCSEKSIRPSVRDQIWKVGSRHSLFVFYVIFYLFLCSFVNNPLQITKWNNFLIYLYMYVIQIKKLKTSTVRSSDCPRETKMGYFSCKNGYISTYHSQLWPFLWKIRQYFGFVVLLKAKCIIWMRFIRNKSVR